MAQSHREGKACARFQGCWKCPCRLYHSYREQFRTESWSTDSFCGYSYQHNVVVQHYELPEEAGEGLLWRKVMQQRSSATHFGCSIINESHSEKSPGQFPLGTRCQSPNLMCWNSERCKPCTQMEGVFCPCLCCTSQTALSTPDTLQEEEWRIQKAEESCCTLTKTWRTGRYGFSKAFCGNRPTK